MRINCRGAPPAAGSSTATAAERLQPAQVLLSRPMHGPEMLSAGGAENGRALGAHPSRALHLPYALEMHHEDNATGGSKEAPHGDKGFPIERKSEDRPT